ncbi:MAG: AMP-binding protein [Candidatus Thiodiazotropha sp.]
MPDYPSVRLWRYDADTALPDSRLAPTQDQRKLDPATVAALGFTSGTTGQPKALAISHGAYLTSLRQVVANIDLSQTRGWRSRTQDRFLVGIPLTGAGSGILLPALLSGACLTIPERYDADTLLDLLINQRINRLFTTPSLLIDLLDHPALRPLPDLQQLLYGTELMPAAKLEEAIARFGPILQQGYGSAEVLPPVTLLTPKQHVVDEGPVFIGPRPGKD